VTHLAVLLDELEGLDEAQDLVHVAAHGQVVDGDLAQVACRGRERRAGEEREKRETRGKEVRGSGHEAG